MTVISNDRGQSSGRCVVPVHPVRDALIEKDWELFVHSLKGHGVSQLPEGVREDSVTAPMMRSTAAVYEYKNPNKPVEAFSVLGHVYESDACIALSPEMSRHVRDTFWRVWDRLAGIPGRRLKT